MAISGVYIIKSTIKPERVYVGSSKNIAKRWHYHLSDLKKNVHHAKKLQRHFNKYGEADLQFSILMECTESDLLTIEQGFIDQLDPYFNSNKWVRGNSLLVGCVPWNKGKTATADAIKNQSEAHKGKAPWNKGKKTGQKPWNKGTKGIMVAWNKGKTKETDDSVMKISENMKGNTNGVGKVTSEETREKQRERALSRPPISDETREKIRQASTGNQNMLGKKRSEETKKKVSEGLKRYFKKKKESSNLLT